MCVYNMSAPTHNFFLGGMSGNPLFVYKYVDMYLYKYMSTHMRTGQVIREPRHLHNTEPTATSPNSQLPDVSSPFRATVLQDSRFGTEGPTYYGSSH